jgi:hypothetical protein
MILLSAERKNNEKYTLFMRKTQENRFFRKDVKQENFRKLYS